MAIQYCDYDIKGTLAVAGNATFSSSQIYLTGGLTSAVPSEYLGRVTGGGGGVMVGRTAAQVLSDIGAVATINEGVGIKKSGTTDVTISVNYDSADTDNLIFGSNLYNAAVATKPYTPYILVADSNPGVSFGEVKSLRIQSIPMNLLGDAAGNIDMGGFRILDVSDPSSAQDAATKAYVDSAVSGVPGASYINAATFSTSTGIITGTGVGSAGFTVDIDGRYPIGNVAAQPFYIALQQNPVGTTYGDGVSAVPTYYFGQKAGDNDAMKFYAESAATNDITAVWEINDDLETGLTWLFRNKKTYSPYTATDALKIDGDGDVTVGKDLTIPEYLYHTGDTNTYLRFQSDSIELQTGGWKVFGNTTLKYGALYGDNALRVYATQAGGYINGTLTVDTINNATSDTDKFLVSDGDEIKYRTGAEVLADIGAGTGTITGSGNNKQLAFFDSGSNITSISSLTRPAAGVLYSEVQYQVKPGATNASYSCTSDTDTGLGDFDGANGVSLISKGVKQITVKEGAIKFDPYTATAVSTTGPLNANQNNQAPTQDTLATLSVDPSGNVVRGEQEATFKFTLAQLNSTLGQTLISAPGADKAVIITYTDWMMEYSSTGTVNNQLEIRQANLAQANASVSVLPALRFNEIVNQSQSGSAPFYGFYTRDIPTGSGSQGRTYAVNKATTFHKQTSSPYPSGLTSISIKIRYRVFDVDTF